MNQRLSKNFWLREFEKSDTAARLVIDNTVKDEEVYNNLVQLVTTVLQPIRDALGPVVINSGYRCLQLNRALHSKDSSQHIKGQAADIEVPGMSNYDLACWIRDNLEFDQLILEYYTPGDPSSGWVHVSISNNPRNQTLTIGRTINKHGIHK